MFEPRNYWEDRARRFGSSPEGWKAVCFLGMPEIYNRLFHKLQKNILKRKLKLAQNEICLEFGCGVGRWLCELSPRAKALHGLDISPAMLSQAHKHLKNSGVKNVYLSRFDGGSIPYRNSSFDLTFSVTVLIHIIDLKSLNHTIAELCRVTKPGGRIIILESFAPKLFPSPPHVKFRPEKELIELFRESGWEIQASIPVYPFLPKESWIRTRSSRILFRLLIPLYYLLNIAGQKFRLAGSPPMHKIQLYCHEETGGMVAGKNLALSTRGGKGSVRLPHSNAYQV